MPRLIIPVGPDRQRASIMVDRLSQSGLNASVEGGGDDTQVVVQFPYNQEGRESAVSIKLMLDQSGVDSRIETANYPGQYQEETGEGYTI